VFDGIISDGTKIKRLPDGAMNMAHLEGLQ